jgi:hypothetical protein
MKDNNSMYKILSTILSLGMKPLYDKQIEFYNILKEFRNLLPRRQKQAKLVDKDNETLNPAIVKLTSIMTVYDLKDHEVTITEKEIDQFFNKINNFDYTGLIFKSYQREFIRNLNRFNPKAANKNFDLVVIQNLLSDEHINDFKPWNTFIYHLKYKYKWSNKIYITYFQRNERRTDS